MTKEHKKYLVTGATGFLGRHLLQSLLPDSNDQAVLLMRDLKSWGNYDWTKSVDRVSLLQGGLDNIETWDDHSDLQSVDGIFHLAGLVRHSRENSEDVYKTNVEGTLNMVRVAAKLKCRLIFVSTSGTVGCFDSPVSWADEQSEYCETMVKNWPYYDSKVVAEKAAKVLAKELGVNMVIVRPPVLLGPGDHRFRASGHVTRLLRKKLPFMLNGGIHFIDIRDAAKAMVAMMRHGDPQPVYHLCGTCCPVDQFFGMIGEVSGIEPPKRFLPVKLAWLLAVVTKKLDQWFPGKGIAFLPDPVVIEMASKNWDIKSRHAKRDLNYQSRDPYETIFDTVLWLSKHHPELKKQEWHWPKSSVSDKRKAA